MSDHTQHIVYRDGTSQEKRALAALDPSFVSVEERSIEALLAFARKYAEELTFYNLENQPEGNWRPFLEGNLKEMAEYALHPEKFAKEPQKLNRLSRPQLALFLAFLRLLEFPRQQIATLTQRHLDYYYQEYLKMIPKPAIPDQVHVLVEAVNSTKQHLLAAGALLDAKKDQTGKPRTYRTRRDLIINHAKIESLKTVFLDKNLLGLKETQEKYEDEPDDGFMKVMELALGDPLPPFRGEIVDLAYLRRQYHLFRFIPSELHLDIREFRLLLDLVAQVEEFDIVAGDTPHEEEWERIINLLSIAGSKHREGAPFTLLPEANHNLEIYIDRALSPDYSQIEGLDLSASNLFAAYVERFQTNEDFSAYIYLSLEDFILLMQAQEDISDYQGDWTTIFKLLEKAYVKKWAVQRQQKLHNVRIAAPNPQQGFKDMLRWALGSPEPGDALPKVSSQQEIDTFDLLADMTDERQLLKKTYIETELLLKVENFQFIWDTLYEAEVVENESWDQIAEAWKQSYRFLERAQQLKRKEQASPLQKEELKCIYAAKDATQLLAGNIEEKDMGLQSWKSFGEAYHIAEVNEPAQIGIAVSSPVLALSQGKRSIQLTIGYQAGDVQEDQISDVLKTAFDMLISTEKEWIVPDKIELTNSNASGTVTSDYYELAGIEKYTDDPDLLGFQFILTLEPTSEAIVAPTEELGFSADWPVLKMLLANRKLDTLSSAKPKFENAYQAFQKLKLGRIHITTKVEGLREFHLQNDETTLDPKKPFEPFGIAPEAGNSLYISHPELVHHKLKSLKFHFDWMGVPSELPKYYAGYKNESEDERTDIIGSNHDFKVSLVLKDQRIKVDIVDIPLFDSDNAKKPHSFIVYDLEEEMGPVFLYKRDTQVALKENILDQKRYFQLELNSPDFQHQNYLRLIRKDPTLKLFPPYTPKLKSFVIDYTTSVEFDLHKVQDQIDKIFHVHPFGLEDISRKNSNDSKVAHTLLPLYQDQGELYIGLKNIAPPQNISLLFKFAEGSANPDLSVPAIQWAYLDENQWLIMPDGSILFDETKGLLNTGIIEFKLTPTQPSTILAKDLYWLKASIPYHPDSINHIIGIHTQAVTAIFQDNDNDPNHYKFPLPAETIKDLVQAQPEIKSILQPYPSMGGKPEENPSFFNTRVSERLRHKNRAVSMWDYERLILEKFPEVYKVKCLPVSLSQGEKNSGRIDIIVIPDLKNQFCSILLSLNHLLMYWIKYQTSLPSIVLHLQTYR